MQYSKIFTRFPHWRGECTQRRWGTSHPHCPKQCGCASRSMSARFFTFLLPRILIIVRICWNSKSCWQSRHGKAERHLLYVVCSPYYLYLMINLPTHCCVKSFSVKMTKGKNASQNCFCIKSWTNCSNLSFPSLTSNDYWQRNNVTGVDNGIDIRLGVFPLSDYLCDAWIIYSVLRLHKNNANDA